MQGKRQKMTMSTEKEVKNGKQSSPPSLSSSNTNPITAVTGKQQVVTELTPATSDDDDFRKSFKQHNSYHKLNSFLNMNPSFFSSTAESRKSLNKPKNGKSEFEGNLINISSKYNAREAGRVFKKRSRKSINLF